MLEGQQSTRDPVALSALADRAGGLLEVGVGWGRGCQALKWGPFWCHSNNEIFSKLVFPLKIVVVS